MHLIERKMNEMEFFFNLIASKNLSGGSVRTLVKCTCFPLVLNKMYAKIMPTIHGAIRVCVGKYVKLIVFIMSFLVKCSESMEKMGIIKNEMLLLLTPANGNLRKIHIFYTQIVSPHNENVCSH